MYANGGNAILNLSGGPIQGHQDQRGFPAVQSLYRFVADNQPYFNDDRSGANVAIVYSQDTLFYYGRDQPKLNYVDAIRGAELALSDAHIPFDLISDAVVKRGDLGKYRAILLPSTACMSEETAEALRSYVQGGGNVIATFETSLFDTDGNRRSDFLLADLFGAAYHSTDSVMGEDNGVYKQSYLNVRAPEHPLLERLGATSVIPASNRYCKVTANGNTSVPLTLSAPFRVFPEGMSYTQEPDTGMPMLIAKEHDGGGRTVYFPGQPDTAFARAGYPDWALLLVNAVRWTTGDRLPLSIDGPETLLATLRVQEGRRLVHLVNVNGGRRMFSELIAARDVTVRLPFSGEFQPQRAFLLSDRSPLAVTQEQDAVIVTVPRVLDYDVVVFE
ncbi:beta-galactosidase trimerization domain-containing protein [Paenibacillus sp. TAB 01]|uniref:beta-galactosidase trimerization domain-containing protein n=1 Tax=Paenibacillus sp. TAB 01 TaxID=3368988 RepID=UPI003753B6CD